MGFVNLILEGVWGLLSLGIDLAHWGYLKGGQNQTPAQAVGTGVEHLAASYLTILLALGMVIAMLVVVFGVPLSAIPVEVIPAP